MIDCNITKNFIHEKKRMCESYSCFECPLSSKTNGTKKTCRVFENYYPDKAIEIVQKWSNKHPQKTLLTEFLKSYPNVKLNNCGYPEYIIPCELGVIHKDCAYHYNSSCDICQDCWNTPIESEVKE